MCFESSGGFCTTGPAVRKVHSASQPIVTNFQTFKPFQTCLACSVANKTQIKVHYFQHRVTSHILQVQNLCYHHCFLCLPGVVEKITIRWIARSIFRTSDL